MKSMTALAVVFLGAMVVVMAHAGPTYAQQTTMAVTNAGSAADSVIVAESPVSVQLVRRGGGGHAFRSGGFRGSGFTRVIIVSGHSYLAGLMADMATATTTLVAARDVIKKATKLASGTGTSTDATLVLTRLIDAKGQGGRLPFERPVSPA